MNTHFNAQIELAVRQQALEEKGAGPLTKLIDKLDHMRAAGDKVEVRLDNVSKRITIVKIEEVTVDLGELAEEALAAVDAEDAEIDLP